MNRNRITALPLTATLLAVFAAVHSIAEAQSTDVRTDQQPSFTQGEAKTNITKLYQWTGSNPRTANVGTIKSADGTEWTVPAKTHFQSASKAADLYNAANGVEPDGIADVDNKPAYTNFIDLFDDSQADAQFIWSSSLVHDNLVLMRTRVRKKD